MSLNNLIYIHNIRKQNKIQHCMMTNCQATQKAVNLNNTHWMDKEQDQLVHTIRRLKKSRIGLAESNHERRHKDTRVCNCRFCGQDSRGAAQLRSSLHCDSCACDVSAHMAAARAGVYE
jgi:hypothetical protein